MVNPLDNHGSPQGSDFFFPPMLDLEKLVGNTLLHSLQRKCHSPGDECTRIRPDHDRQS